MTSSPLVGPDATTDPDTAALRGRAAAGTALALALAQQGGTAVQDWATGSALPAVTAAATTVADRASGVATDTVLPALTVAAAHARDAVLESGPAHQVAARAALVAAGARQRRGRWPLLALGVVAGLALGAAAASRRRRSAPSTPSESEAGPIMSAGGPPVAPGHPGTTRNVGGSTGGLPSLADPVPDGGPGAASGPAISEPPAPSSPVTELPPATTAGVDGELHT